MSSYAKASNGHSKRKLLGNNTEAEDNFGYAVDVDGNFAIVTSPKNRGGGCRLHLRA